MNYRLKGLEKEADVVDQSLRETGLLSCDLEVIGAILFLKYRGEDSKFSKIQENTSKLIEEAEELLRRLKEEI